MKFTTGLLAALLAVAVFSLGLFGTLNAQTKPKYTIKQIMKDGLKGGLWITCLESRYREASGIYQN